MSRALDRRRFMAGTAAGAAALTMPAIAQGAPFRIGLLTVKTGPLAQGGNQMEQGITTLLKQKSSTFAGRKIELVSADTGGNPAGAKTKASELIERDKVDIILGPLAAFELLAIADYVRDQGMPLISLAAAEDMTQRHANAWIMRTSATSAQCCHPLGDYAAKELKYKRVAMIAEDLAFGYEQFAGFQRVLGQWRQGDQEAVAAAGDAGLHAVSGADRQCRRGGERVRGIESRQVHARLCGPRSQDEIPHDRRLDRDG